MQIASAQINQSTTHVSQKQSSVSESLRFWVGDRGNRADNRRPADDSAVVALSDQGRSAQSADQINKDLQDAVSKSPYLSLLRQLLEAMTGEKIRVFDLQELQASYQQSSYTAVSENIQAQQAGQSQGQSSEASPGYGLAYDYHASYSEFEQTTFSASGTVKTKDGQEISFDIQLSMTRSYQEQTDMSLRMGDTSRLTDPLVLNFDGNAAQLLDSRFSFDLDADGEKEKISRLGSGSGFLVFDRNGNGKIDNGKEMFGPASGNGFTELTALDDDKNGWIDENDSNYRNLRIWQPDEKGNGTLHTLQDFGIGALSLSALETPFSVKDGNNQLLGQVRRTSLSLQEDGTPGTLQQVDLSA